MSKGEFLLAIAAQQLRIGPLMIEAETAKNRGNLELAASAYARLAEALREQLRATESHNAEFAGTAMDVRPVAEQLANSLLTHADVADTLGDSQRAETLRAEASNVSARYFDDVGSAERKRQIAVSLLGQSRYHEAIVALEEARDAFVAAGEALEVVVVTADLAELLEWLGDDERASA